MDLSNDTQEKILKSAIVIYSKGLVDGKSAKKNQTQTEKDLVRLAEGVAKRVDEKKNVPDEKKVATHLKNNIGTEVSRDSLIRIGTDFLARAFSMPKPVKTTPTKTDAK